MFSFLFSKKKSSKEQNPSSANDSNSLANPSFANLISQINNLKEENERFYLGKNHLFIVS